MRAKLRRRCRPQEAGEPRRTISANVNHPESELMAIGRNVELAYVPTNASLSNRFACHFTALRRFALDGTDLRSHEEQNSMIHRYNARRNRHPHHEELRAISMRAKVA